MMRWVAALLLIFSTLVAKAAAGNEQLFNNATKLLKEGNYDLSIKTYEQLLHAGVTTPAVYGNLGNGYFKSGNPGKAMLTYERGLLQAPFNNLLINNRDVLSAALQANPGSFDHFTGVNDTILLQLTDRALLIVTILLVIAALCYILSVSTGSGISRRFRKMFRYLMFIAVPANMICLGMLWYINQADYGIVQQNSKAKAGPGSLAREKFQLKAGEKVLLLTSFDGWFKFKTGDGNVAWLNKNSLTEIAE